MLERLDDLAAGLSGTNSGGTGADIGPDGIAGDPRTERSLLNQPVHRLAHWTSQRSDMRSTF